MSDYSNTKPNPSGIYPEGRLALHDDQGSGFTRVEAFLTPEVLKNEYMFGIPLFSPVTKQVLSDETIKSVINRAYAKIEIECKINIFQQQVMKRLEFDKTKFFQGWGQLNLGVRNIRSIEELSIRTSNSFQTSNMSGYLDPVEKDGSIIYNYPLTWLDMSLAHKGLISCVPLQTTYATTGIGATPISGPQAALFAAFTRLSYIPGFWYVRFTTGFPNNSIPSIVNELAACYACISLLSMLGPGTNRNNSQSISIDASSQSVSNQGPNIYQQRIVDLTTKAAEIKDQVNGYFRQKIYMETM
jgi:hypothetical protein